MLKFVRLSGGFAMLAYAVDLKEQAPFPSFKKVPVRETLEESEKFEQAMFDKLLTRVDSDHLFLTDVRNMIYSLKEDYPELITISTIGKSW